MVLLLLLHSILPLMGEMMYYSTLTLIASVLLPIRPVYSTTSAAWFRRREAVFRVLKPSSTEEPMLGSSSRAKGRIV